MIPGNTRMVAYAGRVLSQSFDDYAARYRATWSCHQHRLEGAAPTRAHRKQVASVRHVGERPPEMADIRSPLFTHVCIHLPVLAGVLDVQTPKPYYAPYS